ncbi:OmpA family protein [Flammeovirgaceae bacterium SG7u.111]|nr:OmpA family protein [Flammeovirgaceae bacterium SG7u.132]WPO35343.1 OmpA family protein [Flammeovirgaceae bacterium SG7u.111]
MKKFVFPFFLLPLLIFIASCSSSYKVAENHFKKGHYNTAIPIFLKTVETSGSEEQKAKINYMVGECYRLSNRLPEAEPFYRKAFVSKAYNDENLLYQYCFALKAAGKYESAEKGFKKYIQEGKEFLKVRRAKQELENLKEIEAVSKVNPYITITNCDALNTEAAEYGPMMFQDNQLVFTSSRMGQEIFESTGKPFTDLFYYDLEANADCKGAARPFNELVNLEGFHEASATFSRDGKVMIFARSNSGKKKDLAEEVNLYISTQEEGEWTEPKLFLPVTTLKYWDGCPILHPDGKTLYFASNRPGGYGGLDIYRTRRNTRGEWSRPTNMGKVINSAGNEMFPFVSREGKLYFASDGHPGMGGLDLFEAVRRDGKITVKNMRPPFNSPSDDFSLAFKTPKTGYFSSNRTSDGAKGDDDIFYFVDETPETKIINYYLAGTTFQEENIKKSLLDEVTLELLDESGDVIGTTKSDSVGRFKFENKLQIGIDYTVRGSKTEFIDANELFSTIGKGRDPEEFDDPENDVVFETELSLYQNIFADLDMEGGEETGEGGRRSVVLEGILYDLDDWRIRPDAARELDKLVIYLKSRPTLKIELGAHTDSRASDRHNMRLSKRRAESAVEYIVSNGIDPERIVAKGYGESQLLIPDAVSEEEHQLNRRTTVTILGEVGDEEEGE